MNDMTLSGIDVPVASSDNGIWGSDVVARMLRALDPARHGYDHAQVPGLRVVDHIGDGIDRRKGHVEGGEALVPFAAVARGEDRIEGRVEGVVIVDAGKPRGKAWIVVEVLRVSRLHQGIPELVDGRQVEGEQFSVLAAHDVGLGKARPVGAARFLTKREIAHERLDGEVHHGFQHGYVDPLALAGSRLL